jgi:hypothetical protein
MRQQHAVAKEAAAAAAATLRTIANLETTLSIAKQRMQ